MPMEFDGTTFIQLLGLTSDDEPVQALLKACDIKQPPRIKRGDVTEVVGNKDLGIEITFRDERHLDVKSKKYDEGSAVLSSIRMYGPGHASFREFKGKLPLDLTFALKPAEAHKKMPGKPAWKNDDASRARWDLPGYCVFLINNAKLEKLASVSVQLPVK